jgi:nicotinamide-nucleotide amidase
MNAIILSIGDELVLGQTVDTNSAWLSQQLAAVGCDVYAHMTIGDDQAVIQRAIARSSWRCDVLLVSGGIGPTEDDMTRQALAAVMNADLVLNEEWLNELDKFFKLRGRTMPERNRIQAMIPRGAQMIFNTAGTAAGIRASIATERTNSHADDHGGLGLATGPSTCEVFVMPGVPKEMKIMFERDVLPYVKEAGGGACILSKTLHTFGLGESSVAEKLGGLMNRNRNPLVGTTVAGGVVSVRVFSRFESRNQTQEQLDQTVQACHGVLGDLIYGENDRTLAEVVSELLVEQNASVTTAESCTGGLVAKMLTDVPGSSNCFNTGFVTYSNDAKYNRLGVSTEMINVYGAVSEPVVEAMSKNALRLAKADYALAISGVAGPGGGSATKPVGMVCIALAWKDGVLVRTFNFPGDREMVRDRAAKMALSMLRYHLLDQKMPF